MPLEQAERRLNFKSPLGDDVLLLTAFRGREEMSRLFQFELQFVSQNLQVKPDEIVGKAVTFSTRMADESFRHFHGFVSRFWAGDQHQGVRNYGAQVVPWLWFLTRSADCRIFQSRSVPQIVEAIFQKLGFSDFEMSINGNHPTRDYCVQYRETDFNFISRLLEEEGIFYYFKHAEDKHQLVLADRPASYYDLPEKEVDYPDDFGSSAVESHIKSWEHSYCYRTGKWAQTDYNFQTPSDSLMTMSKTVVSLPANDKFEVYDYPGRYDNTGDGQALTDVRMEEVEAGYDVVDATSNCSTFSPGGKFKVRQHRASSEVGASMAILSVDHEAYETAAYETSPGDEAPFDYLNRFRAIPDTVPFRPECLTPKPYVRGVQTAKVVGPLGEELYTDEYGRVKVQFHWDRKGGSNEMSSCWMRVSQIHAGKGFGGIDIPRIDEEVIVSFLEGDPDQPIVTGRVYHAENMPPYGLPDKKVVSGMKSKTYKGSGYNEYIMDDSPGNELIQEHGQFDKDSTIEHDLREHVLNDRSRDVSNNESVMVGANQTIQIGQNRTITVGANHSESIGANMTINVGSNLTETVALNYAETIGIAFALTVGAAMTQTIGAAYTLAVGGPVGISVGGNQSTSIGGSRVENVASKVTEAVGGDVAQKYGGKHSEDVQGEFSLKSHAKILLDAADEIKLVTGSSSITLKKSGDIEIKGTNISVKGSAKIEESAANITSTASAQHETKGAKVKVAASAMAEISGALVKIN